MNFDEFKQIINESTEKKPNKWTIEFDENPAKVYNAGQQISGTIQLTLHEKKKVRSAYAKILGKAFVRWAEYNDNDNEGNEKFFEERIELVPKSNDAIRLVPGLYTYNFQCQLPNHLPSSLEYKFGYIRYKVCAVLDNYLWSNEEFEKSFTVIGVSDLTSCMLEPVTTRNSTIFFSLCCFPNCLPSDPLEIFAEIPRSGYLPRQTINLHLDVNNMSRQPVVEFTIQLIQKLQYFTHANSSAKKIDKIVLKQEYVPGCEAGESKEIDVNILVPTVPPNGNSICNIINIQYFIRIMVSVPCCHSDSELHLPITIGSNPVQDHPNLPAWINFLVNDFP